MFVHNRLLVLPWDTDESVSLSEEISQTHLCHPRENGDPVFHKLFWIPASAGMTVYGIDNLFPLKGTGLAKSQTGSEQLFVYARRHESSAIFNHVRL